jgi:hypothetical protein
MKRSNFALLCASATLVASWSRAAADTQGVRFSGQLIDYEGGFIYFTTGDGFRLAPDVKVIDAKTGGAPLVAPHVKVYARVTFNPANGQIIEVATSKTPLPPEVPIDVVRQFAVAISNPTANPDLINHGPGRNGKPVVINFTVQVPARTPLTDTVYMSTDQSNWDPQAIRMDRIDALHYRIQRTYASGTHLLYLFTRGSWNSAERGKDGLQIPPRIFDVPNADTLTVSKTVENWADQSLGAPDLGPQNVPTPYNANPFPFNTPTPSPRPRPPR